MRFTKTIFFLALFYSQQAFAQLLKADSNCCSLSKEVIADNAIGKVLAQFQLMLSMGNFDLLSGMITKSKQLQSDSFACCLTSKYLILDAETISAMAKKDFKALVPLTKEIMALIDKISDRYKESNEANDLQTYSYLRLLTLQKRYMGYVHTLSGDELDRLDVAIDSLGALALKKPSPYEIPYLLSRAYYYQSFKDYKTAEQSIEKVFALLQKQGEDPMIMTAAYNAMALVNFEKGDNKQAITYCDSGLAVLNTITIKHPYYTYKKTLQLPLLINESNALVKLGRFIVADSVLKEALILFKNFKDTTNWVGARLLHAYGTCQLFMGHYNAAFSAISEANQKYIKYLLYYFGSLHEDDKFQLIGTVDEAFNALPILLNKIPQASRAQTIKQIYDEQLTLKGLILKSQCLLKSALLEEKDSITLSLYKEWNAASGRLLGWVQGNVSWNSKEAMDIEKTKKDCEERLYQHSGIFKKVIDQLGVSGNQVQHSLQKGETAIELIQYKEIDWNKRTWSGVNKYAAIICNSNDTSIKYVDLCKESDLMGLFKKVGADEINVNRISMLCFQPYKNTRSYQHFDDSLYKYILQPLLPYLKGTKTIYFSPVGLLNRIPFQALSYMGKGPLINYFDVRTLLTTGSLVNRQAYEYNLPKTASLWYNINYGNPALKKHIDTNGWLGYLRNQLDIKWDKLSGNLFLPGVMQYLSKAGIKSFAFQKNNASESAFKHLAATQAEILHIETHGFSVPVKPVKFTPVSENFYVWQARHPMFFNGLFLANSRYTWQGYPVLDTMENNILTAYEVTQMDLRKTRLVVLGACETGLGQINENEGVYGLGRGFKIAGVDKIILSLWSIPDEQSQVMFRSFYKFWLKKGLTVNEAFRSAQQKAFQKYKLPYFWSGFILIE